MTRKDYVAIAEAIAVSRGNGVSDEWNQGVLVTAYNIADVMQADNHRFDRARFLKACGVE